MLVQLRLDCHRAILKWTDYDSIETALHDLQWGTVGHPVTSVLLKNADKTERITEAEFRARYLPPARG